MIDHEREAKIACVQAAATLMAAARGHKYRPGWDPDSEATQYAWIAKRIYDEVFGGINLPTGGL
jgi:hypothetical protein